MTTFHPTCPRQALLFPITCFTFPLFPLGDWIYFKTLFPFPHTCGADTSWQLTAPTRQFSPPSRAMEPLFRQILQMPAKLCLIPQTWALGSVLCSHCTGADSPWRIWENHNSWSGRIKEFSHPPTPFFMFLHLTANRGEKIESRWLWVCDTQPGSCREIDGKRNSIWLQ